LRANSGKARRRFLKSREYQEQGVKNMTKDFLRDETGLELSEYAVAAALIAIACVVAFRSLGTAIGNRIDTLAATING
jgi:pilus assembly protein Flp/PilA